MAAPQSGVAIRWRMPEADLHRAVEARERAVSFLLRHRVTAQHMSESLFYSPMSGRVLDTALTLHVLQQNRLHGAWQTKLRGFVVANLDAADMFSSTVARSVLTHSEREDPAYSANLTTLLRGLQHARRRKKALLSTILAEVSAISWDAVDFDPALFSDEVAHLFSHIYFAAIKLIHGRRARAVAEDGTAEVAFLLETQAKNGSWEQQSLLTLMALIALGPQNDAFRRGLAFLRSVTRDDGGVAFCDNLNLWTTGLAGLALIPGVELATEAVDGVAAYILSQQQHGGGWAFSEGVTQPDTDTSAQCVQLLLQLDKDRYSSAIESAHDYFASRQRPDGGYPTYEIGGASEATMTANIALIQAMSVDAHPEFRPRIERAIDFICTHQSPEGTFERSWSLSEVYAIFRVNLAFDTCRHVVSNLAIDRAKQRSASYLMASQHADGGWGHTVTSPSDGLSTAYALLSLCLLRPWVPPAYLGAGLEYLLSQQNPLTGEVVSLPDVVGPRPIVFNIPLLSTIFAVMALRAMERG